MQINWQNFSSIFTQFNMKMNKLQMFYYTEGKY